MRFKLTFIIKSVTRIFNFIIPLIILYISYDILLTDSPTLTCTEIESIINTCNSESELYQELYALMLKCQAYDFTIYVCVHSIIALAFIQLIVKVINLLFDIKNKICKNGARQ